MERQHHRFLSAAMAMVFGSINARNEPEERKRWRRKKAFRHYGGWAYPVNGQRANERRVRQIAAGSLTVANGLALS